MDDAAFNSARQEVLAAINDDLNVPKAIGLLHDAKSYKLWLEFDPILALDMEPAPVLWTRRARCPPPCRRK